ncbi:MAG: MBL fold metallo-hydrolase [Verrucomicrobiales bacterium]
MNAQLEITFLGSGTSQGVPMIGCDCAVCRSKDPRDVRTRSSVLVRSPEATMVIDTGPEFRVQCLRENVRHLDAVLYTHAHTDHIMGFDDLRRFCDFRGGSIPIYASPETMADLERIYQFAFKSPHQIPGYVKPEARVVDAPFTIGHTEIHPLVLPHGKITSQGYLFSREGRKLFAYLTDCHAVPEQVIHQVYGVEMMVIDAVRPEPHPTHLSFHQALAAIERIKPGCAYFTHLAHVVSHRELEETLPARVRPSYDGLVVEIL